LAVWADEHTRKDRRDRTSERDQHYCFMVMMRLESFTGERAGKVKGER